MLLDLYDPENGPLLIVGKEGAGKTQFLQCIAEYMEFTHNAQQIQFGVITNRVEEWPGVGRVRTVRYPAVASSWGTLSSGPAPVELPT